MTINVDIASISSVADAIKRIKAYKESLPSKCEELAKRLSDLGTNYADTYFKSAVYDLDLDEESRGTPDITVTLSEPTTDGNTVKYVITAAGKDVAFVEFGAGVYYNSSGDSYHTVRPEGIVGIGEYGKGLGKRNAWVFGVKNAKGDRKGHYITHGTPEQPGMALSAKEMREWLYQIAREVFDA